MSTPQYTRKKVAGFENIDCHADGEVSIEYEYWDERGNSYISEMSYTVDELMLIIKEANAHKKAYAMFKESGFENEEGYERTMLFLTGAK